MTYPSLITIHSFASFDDFSCSKKNNSDQELNYYLNRLGYRNENYKKYYHIINQSNNMTKKEICAGLTEMKLAPLLSPEISCSEAFSQCTNKWDKVTGWLYNYYKATCPCALWSSRTKFIVNIHSVKNWKKKIGRQKTRWNIKHLQNKKNQYLQDVSKKDFPCGDLKEEKGIQVQLVAPRLRFLLPHSLQEWFSF